MFKFLLTSGLSLAVAAIAFGTSATTAEAYSYYGGYGNSYYGGYNNYNYQPAYRTSSISYPVGGSYYGNYNRGYGYGNYGCRNSNHRYHAHHRRYSSYNNYNYGCSSCNRYW